MRAAVAERDHRAPGDGGRLVQIALQAGQGAPSRGGHFLLGKRGLERDLEQRLERLPRELRRHRQPHRRLVRAGVGAKLRAHPFDQLVDVGGRPALRAPPEEIDREARESRLAPRVLGGAGRQGQANVKERQPAPLDGNEQEPRGILLDGERRQRDVGVVHDCASSEGTSVTTLRRCGAKSAFETRCTSCAEMAA
jgi:hypothetical protein